MKTRHVENEWKQHRTEGAAAQHSVQRPLLPGMTARALSSLLLLFFFSHPAAKDAKKHLTNSYGGGYYIEKAGSTKSGRGMQKDCEVDSYV